MATIKLYKFYHNFEKTFTPVATFKDTDTTYIGKAMLENFSEIFKDEVDVIEYASTPYAIAMYGKKLKLFGEKYGVKQDIIAEIKARYLSNPASFIDAVEHDWKHKDLKENCRAYYILVTGDTFPVNLLRRLEVMERKNCPTF